jgi:hypothetical protein
MKSKNENVKNCTSKLKPSSRWKKLKGGAQTNEEKKNEK